MRLNYAGKNGCMSFTDSNGIDHYYFVVKVNQLPEGLSLAANPREPNLKKPVAKAIKETLESGKGNFLQKNLGITILARTVEIDLQHNVAEINLGQIPVADSERERNPYGIANGGHTYKTIIKSRNEIATSDDSRLLDAELLDNQFVSVRVIVNTKKGEALEMAQALNTSLNVDKESIHNLKGNFKWIKKALGDELCKRIIWHQGDEGILQVVDLYSLLLCMHPEKFRVSENPYIDDHPNRVYTSKAAARKEYDQSGKTISDPKSIKRLGPLAEDILNLKDYIHLKAFELLPDKLKSRNPAVELTETTKPGKRFVSGEFMSQEPDHILNVAAIYPLMASYRCLIKLGTEYRWNVKGGLKGVKELYVDRLLGKQLETLEEIIKKNHKDASPTQWGKDEYIYSSCYRIINAAYKNK